AYVFRPVQRITDWRAAQRVNIVQRRDDVLGHPECLHFRYVRVHLPWRFGIRRVLEDHLDAINLKLLDGCLDVAARRDQARGAGRDGLAEALTNITVWTGRQQQSVLVEQPPIHRVAGVNVLGDRVLHEIDGSNDGNLSRPHICFVDDAANPTPMVDMSVGIDYGRDRKALANVLLEQLPRRARRLRGHQGVKDDPAGLAPDEGDVGEVKPADLIDARDHLVESVV